MATTQRKELQMTKELSMSPSAVRSRERRAAAAAKKEGGAVKTAAPKSEASRKVPASRKQPTAAPIKLNAAQKRTVGQFCAAIAAGFLPIASFVMAHVEAQVAGQGYLWLLVAAALTFSAPTLANWASKWCGGPVKAWGFTILLEGVMVASHTAWLSYAGLAILVAINATNAWGLAARKEVRVEQA